MSTEPRALIFADAAYVWSVLASRHNVPLNHLHGDFQAAAKLIVDQVATGLGMPVWMSRWYDADYEQSGRFRTPNPRAAEIGRMAGVRMCMGRTVDLPGPEGRQIQKGVDTALVVDMTLAAVKATASHLVLLSGDDDMEPGVIAAQDLGITVTLLRVVDENGISIGVSRYLQAVVNQVIDLPVTALLEAFAARPALALPGEFSSPVARQLRATTPVDCLSFVSPEAFLHAVETARGKDAETISQLYADALMEHNSHSQNQTLFRWHEAEGSLVPVRVDRDLIDFADRAGLDGTSQDVRKVLRSQFTKVVGLGLPSKLNMHDVVACDVEDETTSVAVTFLVESEEVS